MKDNNERVNLDLLDGLFEDDVMEKMKISPYDIKERVWEKLNTEEGQKKGNRFYRVMRPLPVAAALLLFGAVTAFAMVHLDVLRDIFSGNTELVREYIYESGASLENGGFRVTLEQAISDNYGTMVIYSVEALTEEAETVLNGDMFMADHDVIIDFPELEDPYQYYSGMSGGNLPEYDTMRKKYYWFQIQGLDELPESGRFRTNILGKEFLEEALPLPRVNRLESYDIVINWRVNSVADYIVYNVGISSISLLVEFGTDIQTDMWDFIEPEIYFRHKDGHIVTKNQLIKFGSGRGGSSEGGRAIHYRMETPVDWQEYISVIVGDMEYPLSGGAPTPFAVPGELKSFLFIPDMNEEGLLRAPMEELSEALGAEYRFDEEEGTLFISWRGVTFETVIGSDVCLLNGVETSYPFGGYFDFQDGRLTGFPSIFSDYFDIGISWVAPFEEDPQARRLWVVTP